MPQGPLFIKMGPRPQGCRLAWLQSFGCFLKGRLEGVPLSRAGHRDDRWPWYLGGGGCPQALPCPCAVSGGTPPPLIAAWTAVPCASPTSVPTPAFQSVCRNPSMSRSNPGIHEREKEEEREKEIGQGQEKGRKGERERERKQAGVGEKYNPTSNS